MYGLISHQVEVENLMIYLFLFVGNSIFIRRGGEPRVESDVSEQSVITLFYKRYDVHFFMQAAGKETKQDFEMV